MGQNIKQVKGKIIFKHQTAAEWDLSNEGAGAQYIPDVGERVLYDPDETHPYTREKFGDGVHIVKDLPFASAPLMDGQVPEEYLPNIGVEKTVSGFSPLVLTNVSEKEHDITVKVNTTPSKNLIDISRLGDQGGDETVVENGIQINYVNTSESYFNVYVFDNADEYLNKPLMISMKLDNLQTDDDFDLTVTPIYHGRDYFGSVSLSKTTTKVSMPIMFEQSDIDDEYNNYDLALDFSLKSSDGEPHDYSFLIKNIQVEIGEEATEYEPYVPYVEDPTVLTVRNGVDTFNFNENGVAKVKSISPETTLTLSDANIEFSAAYFTRFTGVLRNETSILTEGSIADPGNTVSLGYATATLPRTSSTNELGINVHDGVVYIDDDRRKLTFTNIVYKGTDSSGTLYGQSSSFYANSELVSFKDNANGTVTWISTASSEIEIREKFDSPLGYYVGIRYWVGSTDADGKVHGRYYYKVIKTTYTEGQFIYDVPEGDVDVVLNSNEPYANINFIIPIEENVNISDGSTALGLATVSSGEGTLVAGYRSISIGDAAAIFGYRNKNFASHALISGDNNLNMKFNGSGGDNTIHGTSNKCYGSCRVLVNGAYNTDTQSSCTLISGNNHTISKVSNGLVAGRGCQVQNATHSITVGEFLENNAIQSAVFGGENKNYARSSLVAGIRNVNKAATGWVGGFENETAEITDGQRPQRVFGKHAKADQNAVDIVGWGSSKDSRSNIYTLYRDGSAKFSGQVEAADPTNATHLTTKNYTDTTFVKKITRKGETTDGVYTVSRTDNSVKLMGMATGGSFANTIAVRGPKKDLRASVPSFQKGESSYTDWLVPKYHLTEVLQVELGGYVTKEYLDEKLAQIEGVVDRILEIQNSLIGGKQ